MQYGYAKQQNISCPHISIERFFQNHARAESHLLGVAMSSNPSAPEAIYLGGFRRFLFIEEAEDSVCMMP